jgi:hypothetical protein
VRAETSRRWVRRGLGLAEEEQYSRVTDSTSSSASSAESGACWRSRFTRPQSTSRAAARAGSAGSP